MAHDASAHIRGIAQYIEAADEVELLLYEIQELRHGYRAKDEAASLADKVAQLHTRFAALERLQTSQTDEATTRDFARLKKTIQSIDHELQEDDVWKATFLSVHRQAESIMDSLEMVLVQCESFVAGSAAELQLDDGKLKESLEAKTRYYIPACNNVLGIISRGIREHKTINGEIVYKFTLMQTRWAKLQTRIAGVQLDFPASDAPSAAILHYPSRYSKPELTGPLTPRGNFAMRPRMSVRTASSSANMSSVSSSSMSAASSRSSYAGDEPPVPAKSAKRLASGKQNIPPVPPLPSTPLAGRRLSHGRTSSYQAPSPPSGFDLATPTRPRWSVSTKPSALASTPGSTRAPTLSGRHSVMGLRNHAPLQARMPSFSRSGSPTGSEASFRDRPQTPSRIPRPQTPSRIARPQTPSRVPRPSHAPRHSISTTTPATARLGLSGVKGGIPAVPQGRPRNSHSRTASNADGGATRYQFTRPGSSMAFRSTPRTQDAEINGIYISNPIDPLDVHIAQAVNALPPTMAVNVQRVDPPLKSYQLDRIELFTARYVFAPKDAALQAPTPYMCKLVDRVGPRAVKGQKTVLVRVRTGFVDLDTYLSSLFE